MDSFEYFQKLAKKQYMINHCVVHKSDGLIYQLDQNAKIEILAIKDGSYVKKNKLKHKGFTYAVTHRAERWTNRMIESTHPDLMISCYLIKDFKE